MLQDSIIDGSRHVGTAYGQRALVALICCAYDEDVGPDSRVADHQGEIPHLGPNYHVFMAGPYGGAHPMPFAATPREIAVLLKSLEQFTRFSETMRADDTVGWEIRSVVLEGVNALIAKAVWTPR